VLVESSDLADREQAMVVVVGSDIVTAWATAVRRLG
jgi:hypothetical protein